MLEKGVEFLLEPTQLPLAVKGGVEAEEGKHDVGLKPGEPLVGGFEVSFGPGGDLQLFVDQFLCSGKCILPLLFASGMGTKSRGIPFVAKITYGEVQGREA